MRAYRFEDDEFKGIQWLVNTVLNPRGYHFTLVHDDEATWWTIMGDGQELASSDQPDDDMFELVKQLLEEAGR